MVERLVNVIVDFQIKNGTLNDNERSVYLYGYTLLLEKFINVVVAIFICLLTGKWVEVGMLLLCIIPLRSYAGGWHAKKFINCTLISNAIVIIGLVFHTFAHPDWLLYVFVEILFFVIIIYMAPVQHNNRVLSDNERKVYKKLCILIWGIESAVMFWLILWAKSQYAPIILYAHLTIMVALILGMLNTTTRK